MAIRAHDPAEWFAALIGLAIGVFAAQCHAANPVDVVPCVSIEDGERRLACYDRAAGRSETPERTMSTGATPVGEITARPTAAETRAGRVPARAGAESATPQATVPGVFGPYWELDPGDKRGTFNYTAYRPNFFLPLRVMQSVNQAPTSPTHGRAGNVPHYRDYETRLQLSLRSKIAEDTGLPGADLWLAYTQQSMWQLWNAGSSAPFRATDHQPEVIYVVPARPSWAALPAGWTWRMWQLGFVHQSNGDSDPLSRSWNRLYGLIGVEKGSVSATLRLEARTDTGGGVENDNPDIVHFLGRSELRVDWSPGAATAALAWRPAPSGRGSLQLDWTYPVYADRPDGLRWYLQVFEGYGETLIDYNFRQSSVGIGLSIFRF